MKYTLPKGGYARTEEYRGTTTNYKDDEDVKALKKSVRLHNEVVRANSRRLGRISGVLRRVRVKGRGPRLSSFYHTLVSEATHFDIYEGEDTEAMYQFQREMDTGMSPGELRRYDKLKMEANQIKWNAIWRKRKKELLRKDKLC